MKKNLLSFTLLSFSFACLAQPTINSSGVFQGGDHVASFYDFSTPVSPGPSGANQIWDFSGLADEYSDTTEYLIASQTADFSGYPNATSAVYDEEWDLHDYYLTNSNGIYQLNHSTEYTYYNLVDDVEETYLLEGPFDNPHTLITFPATYNTSWEGVYVFKDSTEGGAYFDSLRVTHTIEDSVVANGYGTVITPEGTYQNALRVTRYTVATTENETKNIVWSSGGTTVISDTTYQWWVPGEIYPVMEILQISAAATGGSQSEPQYYAVYNKEVFVTGLFKPLSYDESAAYPNPSSGSFFVRNADKVVSVLDASGSETECSSFPFGNNSLKVELKDKKSGLYFVKVSLKGEIRLVKMAVFE